ncbi:MAG TPA: glycosyltransferase family 4 protein [Candidatus Saccharimonadales bacterium]|nr:glycosyltransferase family 4 protein [Candidatus Saccharimonadales bacterium]
MNLLWITWKDHLHPEAGGAEVVCHELTQRLAAEGHKVTLLTARYPGSKQREESNGVTYIRVGSNRYIHPLLAGLYYLRHLRNTFDVVVEEIQGCAPYFAVFFGRSSHRFLFYHQLARKNWLYEVRAPFSYLGYYILAPLATRLVSLSRAPVITVSESTRSVLAQYGFDADRTHIISEGLHFAPLEQLTGIQKYSRPTILSFGAMRAMKRTLDQVKAFEIAKEKMPDLQLKIAGSSSGAYGRAVLDYIAQSTYQTDIEYLGRVSTQQKAELMQKSHVIVVTSVEEGWGLIVSEANGQGTPAVVYDVEGLRDSVQHNRTGLVTQQTPEALAAGVLDILQDPQKYATLQANSHRFSKNLTFQRSYQDFLTTVEAA